MICLKKSHKKDKILHKIQTKTAEKTLKDAAKCRQDEEMLHRIEMEDLIAADAVYHASCLVYYTNKKYMQKHCISTELEFEESDHSQAFGELIEYVDLEIFQNRKALLLTSLLDVYKSFLPENVDASAC